MPFCIQTLLLNTLVHSRLFFTPSKKAGPKKTDKGQVLAEYGLLFGLVTVGAIAAIITMRDELIAMFTKLTAGLAGIGVP